MKKGDLLRSALEIVEKRGLTYGQAENNFARIAALWTAYLDQRTMHAPAGHVNYIGETDVAAMMALMKIARLMEKPDHLDSWLDLAGYAACGAEVSGAGEDKVVVQDFGVEEPGLFQDWHELFDAEAEAEAAEEDLREFDSQQKQNQAFAEPGPWPPIGARVRHYSGPDVGTVDRVTGEGDERRHVIRWDSGSRGFCRAYDLIVVANEWPSGTVQPK